ncbi:hypothetical protein TIFTF001_030941 [Ficus carica]|uniref:Uncharacterized protein n=1 Tax=Ficus carica TaxID=3494 RepID=A0AA88DU03_FICCA|nr:hypothetical protein TIFTF001_030941 [Ficus carica]
MAEEGKKAGRWKREGRKKKEVRKSREIRLRGRDRGKSWSAGKVREERQTMGWTGGGKGKMEK